MCALQPSHALFKEFLAGAAGFEVDRLVETKGADAIDRQAFRWRVVWRARAS